MKIFQIKAMKVFATTLFSCLFFMPFFSHAFDGGNLEVKKTLKDYIQECPWLGLIANEITYGPITISNVNIHDGYKFALVVPGETLHGILKYKIDSEDLSMLHIYHVVIGIKDEGAQDCVVHNLGLWDSKGVGHFNLTAPISPGIYEVRFLLTEGLTCDAAHAVWNSGAETPPESATIGIIIVEDPTNPGHGS